MAIAILVMLLTPGERALTLPCQRRRRRKPRGLLERRSLEHRLTVHLRDRETKPSAAAQEAGVHGMPRRASMPQE